MTSSVSTSTNPFFDNADTHVRTNGAPSMNDRRRSASNENGSSSTSSSPSLSPREPTANNSTLLLGGTVSSSTTRRWGIEESNGSHEQVVQTHLNSTSVALKRALASAEESKAVAGATMVEIDRQNEQLRNASNRLDEVDANLNRSERLLRGMGSLWGSFVNKLTKDKSDVAWQPPTSASRKGPSPPKSPHGTQSKTGTGGGGITSWFSRKPADTATSDSNGNAPSQKPTSTTSAGALAGLSEQQRAQVADDDEALDELAASLSTLKFMASDMGRGIEESRQELDTLHAKTDRSNARMKKVQRKIDRI